MGRPSNKFIKYNVDIAFETLKKITNLADGATTNDAINYGQLQNVIGLINGMEWQNSAIDYVTDNTGVPVTEVLGDRYILAHDGGAPNAAYDGASAGDIVEFDGTNWVATTPTTGMFISADNEDTLLYYWGGAAWVTKAFESTTASLGLDKVGFDIRLAASSAGNGIDLTTGVYSVEAEDGTIAVSAAGIKVNSITSALVSDFVEAAQDAVGGILTDSATIDFTYDDGAGTITAIIIDDSIDEDALKGLGTGVDNQTLQSDGAGGFKWVTLAAAASPTSSDKDQASAVVSTDGGTTGITITSTPASDSYVKVEIDGIGFVLGDGVKTKDFFFSADGGTTARAIADIAAGDTLYYNAVIVGADLAVTDNISLFYNA